MRILISLTVALVIAIVVAAWGLFSLGSANARIDALETEARLEAQRISDIVKSAQDAADADAEQIRQLSTSCGRDADTGFDAGLRLGKSFCALP